MAQTVVPTADTEPAVPHPEPAHETNMGVSNNKLAIWQFISSEALTRGIALVASHAELGAKLAKHLTLGKERVS